MDNSSVIKYDLFSNLTQDQKNKNIQWWVNQRQYSDISQKVVEEKIDALIAAGANITLNPNNKTLTFSYAVAGEKEQNPIENKSENTNKIKI